MLVMAKLFCTISMAILRIYTAELLPTALRGSGLGVITGVSYFGANVMPFMLKLVSFNCYGFTDLMIPCINNKTNQK